MIRADPNITMCADLLYANATTISAARAHLRHERHLIDGYPGGNDEPVVTATSETTPVERAVLARQHIDNRLADLGALVRGLVTLTLELCRTADTALGVRVETPRCSATGREGAMLARADGGWSDPTCTNVPSRGPLCDSCARRETRFRQARNLPPRSDGLFSGGDAA